MRKFFVCAAFMVSALGFSQNQGSIKGNVLDNELQQEPLLFAYVTLKDAGRNTETNFHGNFEFNDLQPGQYTLTISYAGYENIELPVVVAADKVTQINCSLSAKQLDFYTLLDVTTISKGNGLASDLNGLPRK